ncbi:MAG TPA: hypothetical protein VL356_14305 [Acidocella sp.]|nr:hypothetical protein [Acidocella sp.]
MRHYLTIGLILLLSGCASERQFAHDSLWPFGNPNAPAANSETAQRALGHQPVVTPIQPQAGDVWPGPVQPMPTLSQVEQNADMPVGKGYQPSLPSPYPPGQGPAPGSYDSGLGTSLYSTTPQGQPAVPPAVPGHTR